MDHRLRKKKQFGYVYKKGVKKSTHFLTLFTLQSKYKNFKIGYSVSKKIGKATVRNKTKRRMKEIIRLNKLPKDYNTYVLMAREGIEKLTFTELENQIKEIFNK